MHLDINHIDTLRELIKVDLAVTSSLDSPDDGDQLLVSCIEAHRIAESVTVEVTHGTCLLTVDQGEGSLGVPTRAPVQRLLHHFQVDVAQDFVLKVIC